MSDRDELTRKLGPEVAEATLWISRDDLEGAEPVAMLAGESDSLALVVAGETGATLCELTHDAAERLRAALDAWLSTR
jgi:hypothetical protein